MPLPFPETDDRLNVLLPLGDQQISRLTRRESAQGWATDEYAAARTAAAEFEAVDFTPTEPDRDLVSQVLQALAVGMGGPAAMGIASQSAGPADYVSLRDLDGAVGPPIGMPLLIEEIGVLSVPAPPEGTHVAAQALQGIRADLGVEPSVPVYALAEMLREDPSASGTIALPADFSLDQGDLEAEWLEASLEVGASAETLPWGVARVNAPPVWARGYLGQGIRVAIVDTGVGPHIDLAAPVASATFVPGTTSANDDNGHGTHVAGTALARRNGLGVVGVAPLAQLMRAKVLSRSGSGHDSWVAAGIVWAANNGARIINLSLGSSSPSAVIDRAVAYARRRGVAICAAAGNDYGRPVSYPARNPLCIAVAAIDQNNRRAAFSNRGPELDLAAPGASILSTFPTNSYRVLNGTSMATPHVAGVAALVLSRRSLDPAALQRLLERTAIPLGPRIEYGCGLVQGHRAVAAASVAGLDGLATEQPGIPSAERRPEPAGAGGGQRGR